MDKRPAQWLERLNADQQVPGSNPGVPSCGSNVVVVVSNVFCMLLRSS